MADRVIVEMMMFMWREGGDSGDGYVHVEGGWQ